MNEFHPHADPYCRSYCLQRTHDTYTDNHISTKHTHSHAARSKRRTMCTTLQQSMRIFRRGFPNKRKERDSMRAYAYVCVCVHISFALRSSMDSVQR